MKRFKINLDISKERYANIQIVDRDVAGADNVKETWYRNFGIFRFKVRSWNKEVTFMTNEEKKAIGFNSKSKK